MIPHPSETERLRIRKLKKSDHEEYFSINRDPACREYCKGTDDYDLSCDWLDEAVTDPEVGEFAIAIKETDELIGIFELGLAHAQEATDVEISIVLLSQYRRHGYALEASREVIRLVCEQREYKRILARVKATNTASQNLVRKLGMRMLSKSEIRKPELLNCDVFAIECETLTY